MHIKGIDLSLNFIENCQGKKPMIWIYNFLYYYKLNVLYVNKKKTVQWIVFVYVFLTIFKS